MAKRYINPNPPFNYYYNSGHWAHDKEFSHGNGTVYNVKEELDGKKYVLACQNEIVSTDSILDFIGENNPNYIDKFTIPGVEIWTNEDWSEGKILTRPISEFNIFP